VVGGTCDVRVVFAAVAEVPTEEAAITMDEAEVLATPQALARPFIALEHAIQLWHVAQHHAPYHHMRCLDCMYAPNKI
jgi:hypothetical protein